MSFIGKRRYEKPRRCWAMQDRSETGRRCNYDCLPGSDYCERHQDRGDARTMHRFYRNRLGETLQKTLADAVENSSLAEDLDLREELALTRMAAGDSVALYDRVKELVDKGEAQGSAMLTAAAQLRDAMQDVTKIVDTVAKAQVLREQVVGTFQSVAATLVATVLRCMYDEFGPDARIAKVEKRIRELVETKLQPGLDGVVTTPADDAAMMDASVPRITHTSNGQAGEGHSNGEATNGSTG